MIFKKKWKEKSDLLLMKTKKFNWLNEINLFILLYLGLSLLYFVSVPVFRIPDEREHFERAYEISMGHLVSDREEHGLGGRDLPSNIHLNIDYRNANMQVVKSLLTTGETLSEKTDFIVFANTALYSPLTYLPQVVGIVFARLFTQKVIFMIYAARLFNWFFALSISIWAIIKSPICKKIMMLTILLPMVMQEMVSCAPDGTGVAVALAIIAFVFELRDTKRKMTGMDKAKMILLAVFISQYKIVYVPLCLLLFLIPYDCFGSKTNYRNWALGLASSVAALSILWLVVSSPYQHAFTTYTFGTTGKEQVAFVLSHPIAYGKVIFQTIQNQAKAYYDQAVGMSMGYYDVYPDPRAILGFEILLPLVAVFEMENKTINLAQRIVPLTVSILVTILVFTSLYVQFNTVGVQEITGVQGRYFLPLVPLLFFTVKIPLPFIRKRQLGYYGMLGVVCVLQLMIIRTAFKTFWGI